MDTVFSSLADTIILINKECNYLQMNQASQDILGVTNNRQKNIEHFFDFRLENLRDETNFLTRLKTSDKWVNLMATKLNDDITLITLKSLSLELYEEHIEHALDNKDEIHEEGLVLFHENRIIDCNFTFARLFRYP